MLIGVLCVLALVLLVIGIVILVKAKKDEQNNYYNAAENILKEEKLDSYLHNPYNGAADSAGSGLKPMVYLKVKDNSKCRYVFSLAKEVCIGRDKDTNQVCVNEPIVSHNHCRIYSDGVSVYLQDLGSANGVEVKRGLIRYALAEGNAMQLQTKDVIKIGTTRIKAVVFYFDTTLM